MAAASSSAPAASTLTVSTSSALTVSTSSSLTVASSESTMGAAEEAWAVYEWHMRALDSTIVERGHDHHDPYLWLRGMISRLRE